MIEIPHLDDTHILVDATRRGQAHTFATLQEASAAAADGATIYLAPDVYWTDDPLSDNSDNHLVGLTLTQQHLTLIGLGQSPADTVICGDRGQMRGAIGNWNTLGIAGSDFTAENITFGNYCNVDLEYAPDPSKNHPRRAPGVTQAQVILPVGSPDRWKFIRCRFISLLNVFSYSRHMGRIYYKDCFFQSTDDSIGTGDINFFENCHFVWYGNHPSGSACETMLVYAGCHFEGRLMYPDMNDHVYFSKAQHRSLAVLDCTLSGNVGEVCWHVSPHPALRCFTYHNSFPISPSSPESSCALENKPDLLRAFKVGNEYNVWNLLRGADDWDPCCQRERFKALGRISWRIRLQPVEARLPVRQSLDIVAEQYTGSEPIRWTVSPSGICRLEPHGDHRLRITNLNPDSCVHDVLVVGKTPQGLEGAGLYSLDYEPLPAPEFSEKPVLIEAGDDADPVLTVQYRLDRTNSDCSSICWYRSKTDSFSQAIPVLTGKAVYPLSVRDNGQYLFAEVIPQAEGTLPGLPIKTKGFPISGIHYAGFHTDFSDLPLTEDLAVTDASEHPRYPSLPLAEGCWQVDAARPDDYPSEHLWSLKARPSKPWSYGNMECDGLVYPGLMSTHRGSRLLFTQTQPYRVQQQKWIIRPEKTAGQGFASPTGQYLDLYIGLDAFSLTGYGVRIERIPQFSDGVRFLLCSWEKGICTPLSQPVYSGCFRGDCHIQMQLDQNTLSLSAYNNQPLLSGQIASGLTEKVSLSVCLPAPAPASGWGVWQTGTGRIALREMSWSGSESVD